MWFKQIQLLQLDDTITYKPDTFAEKLEPLAFHPCLPTMQSSVGWVSPLDEENAPLVHAANGYMMICLQFEEKILPATVVRQEVQEKVKKLEASQQRRIRHKEKLSLMDEITITLLPRAFSKYTRVYGYIDTKNNWLVLNTTNAGKTEQFISLFKKAITERIRPFEVKKLSPIITHWLKNQNYPAAFAIEKACVLQDASEQSRIIRCQQQDLFAASIQAFIEDNCEVKQLALCWHDRVNFVLVDDFSLRSIKLQDEVIEQIKEINVETRQQQFDADFFIMTETFAGLLTELLAIFKESATQEPAQVVAEQEPEAALV